MARKNTQKNNSLCEKSMQVMMNIVKFSALSLATMSLDDKHEENKVLTIKPFKSSSSNSHLSKRQAPWSKMYSKEGGYFIRSSSYMKRGTKDYCLDDDNFSDYIERFHKRNQNELNTEIANGKVTAYSGTFHEKDSRDYSLAGFPLVLPPPPPAAFKK